MDLVGNALVIPLVDAKLATCDRYDVCSGVALLNLSDQYVDRIRDSPELSARYGRSLNYMKVGLSIQPNAVAGDCPTTWSAILELGTFAALTLRLVTGVPLDIPYWFDVKDDEIKGYGNTLVKTYRTGNRYMYSLDEGLQSQGLSSFRTGFNFLLQKHLAESAKNLLIRAIRFSAIAFETRHVLPRLVNNTTALEALFCNASTELAFQVASRISWYLESENTDETRLGLFEKIKDLYAWRSKIVHGGDVSERSEKLKDMLVFSEIVNTRVLQRILDKHHVEIFGRANSFRDQQLRALSLGANCELLPSNA